MANAFLSVGNTDKAVSAQEIVTQVDPTQQTFSNLAIFAYQAGQTRKGDLASAKAVDLAPKDEQEGPQDPARLGQDPGAAPSNSSRPCRRATPAVGG